MGWIGAVLAVLAVLAVHGGASAIVREREGEFRTWGVGIGVGLGWDWGGIGCRVCGLEEGESDVSVSR